MLKFIIDTQLPPKLAKYLRDKDLPTVHTTYYPNGYLLDDRAIVEIAIRENRIIVTKDSDFLADQGIKRFYTLLSTLIYSFNRAISILKHLRVFFIKIRGILIGFC